jgi:NTE family protein
MKSMLVLVTALLALGWCNSPALAEEITERPRIGLALSGGGARGGAHVGVLKVLEELEVPIDYIAGTSMGAIIGGLYASGYSADEIGRLLQETDWARALSDQPERRNRTMRKKELEADFLIPYRVGFNDGGVQLPLGLIEGQHLDQLFQRLLLPVVGVTRFDRLPIPFRAVATNLVTGEEVVLSEGSLPDALRASMSVPGVFSPVRLDGRLLVDGGMSNNLPVSVVRDMGADIVIAVDISSVLLTEDQLTSVLSVTEQLTNFLTRKTTERQIESLAPSDILIVPDLGQFSAADFSDAERIVPLGAEAARLHEAELLAMAVPAAEATPALVRDVADIDYLVEFIQIENGSVLTDEMIRSRLDVEVGDRLDLQALERSIDRIYSLDVFQSVTYNLIEDEQGRKGLVIYANNRDWGPNYLQFGLELANDFSGNNEFKLGAAYTRNALNRLGGELRVVGSIGREDELSFNFYQPIDLRANWFVNPELYWKRQNINVWVGDANVAKFEISGGGARIGLGRNFSTTDLIRMDYRLAQSDADLVTGLLPGVFEDEVDIGEISLEYWHDSLDSLHFPTEGMQHRLNYLYASDTLGAARDYEQAEGNSSIAMTWGKNTALLNLMAGYSFDDAAPLERWFRLGGFGRLSGLVPDQLSGRHAAVATLALYRRLNDIDFIPAYAGVTLETGNVWLNRDAIGLDDLRYSGSLFVGAETPIGPVYLAVGHSDNGDTTAYFYVGNPFRVTRQE